MIKARALTKAEQDTLEVVLDKTSIASVLDAMATISRLKAIHIREAWQDNETARLWDYDADKLERIANQVHSF